MTPSGPLMHRRRQLARTLVALVALAVTLTSALVAGGARSADRPGSIVFVRGHAVWTMRADGTGAHRLRRNIDVSELAWSSDGRKLAFLTADGISVMDAAGKRVTTVFTPGEDLSAPRSPTWSPDGQTIAFTAYSNDDRDIWLVDVAGKNLRRLALTPGRFETQVDWSPTGGRLAVTDGGWVSDIWVVNTNGAYLRILTPGRLEGLDPDWSPGGRRIAYTRWSGTGYENEIVVVGADGRSRARLTNNVEDDRNPSWSSDGRKITYQRMYPLQGYPAEIRVVNPNGTGARLLTGNAWEPAWQPVPLP